MTEAHQPLHLKYRPQTFDDVIGQAHVVSSLRNLVEKEHAQNAYLFGGPSGTGKTTLARICARALGCSDKLNILEIDAATNTGIDAMRTVSRKLHLRPLGGKNVAVIVDEAHALSHAAWQSLLKILEEPPEHVYWFLCTTEPSRVPAAVKTRCAEYNLQEVSTDDIFDLLGRVDVAENLGTSDDVLDLVATKARGSPRQALVYLAMVAGMTAEEDAARSIGGVAPADKELIELLRKIVQGNAVTWEAVVEYIKANKDRDAESMRLQIVHYLTAVLLNTKKEARAQALLGKLELFSEPCRRGEGVAPLLLAFGELTLR